MSLVTTSKSNWIVGVQALHCNPYDGHTWKDAINQMEKITSVRPKECYVDQGYKGTDHHPEDVQVYLSNKSRKKMTRWERMWMNRRSAIEPVIFHLKHDHNMIRNFLKGKEGDRINAILSAAGFNFSKLIRAFFVIWEILSLHRFYFQFESCFFSSKISIFQGRLGRISFFS
ncbi:transposase DDE domain protein [Leptospira mayottensis 200901122]|uniref:Transposase DDE domain protein n=1 Tax=Leptospira mayottensis 200901122 TaxID=1193010 RepID=A0AA87MQ33_9LEPT|nr:transposase [Leptospira mayottensis]EKS00314.1 transposase DDE domain protein [Leptospira mayottensis 200901122]